MEVGVSIIVVSNGVEDISNRTATVTDGTEVLVGISDVAHGRTSIMGLILKLRYPEILKYTFEVFKKMKFLKLENINQKVSSKVHDLKVSLKA